jgi:fucose permease
VLTLAAIVAFFVYGLIASMLGTILPDLSKRFDLSPSQNGSIAFSQALGLILASLSVGPLLDNEGKKIGLVLGLTLISAALYALPRSRGFRIITLLFFLLGVGGGIVVTGATALVSDVNPLHRGTALSLVNLFFGLGGLITPFLSANIFSNNWMKLCYSVATLTVITLAIQLVTRMPAPTGAEHFAFADVHHTLGRPLLFLLGIFLFLYIACEVGVWNWLPRHLIAQGIPEARALNILSFGFALGLLVGRAAVSPVLIHVPAVTVNLGASIAMAVTTFFMLRVRSSGAAIAVVFLAGLAMAPVFPTTLSIVGDAFPRMAGTAIGFVITCGWAGLAVSSRVIGMIAGNNPLRLKKALLVIPAAAVLMIGMDLMIYSALR